MPEFTFIQAAIGRMLEDASTSEPKRRHLERIPLEIEALAVRPARTLQTCSCIASGFQSDPYQVRGEN